MPTFVEFNLVELERKAPVTATLGQLPACETGYPSMLCGRTSGLSSRKASGSSAVGKFWNATGRRKRAMDAVPTAVMVDAVVAGYGPPCCCA